MNPSTISLQNWMNGVGGEVSLADINIPGSHDAAAIDPTQTQDARTDDYTRHTLTITQQLLGGIRFLDIRIRYYSGDPHGWSTCHGGDQSASHIYQSFESVLAECKAFLASNHREVVLMLIRVPYWTTGSNHESAVNNELRAILARYADVITRPSFLPTLGQVRGKVLIYNGINDDATIGVPLSWEGDAENKPANGSTNRDYGVIVQDHGGTTRDRWATTTSFKSYDEVRWARFEATLEHPSETPGSRYLVLNFGSGTYWTTGITNIKPMFLSHLGEKAAAARETKLGICLFDFPHTNYRTTPYGLMTIVDVIVRSNFGYAGYPDTFTVDATSLVPTVPPGLVADPVEPPSSPRRGTFTDSRDEKVYKTIELGGRTWLAQNLDYDTGDGGCYYDNAPENGLLYGRLYTWDAAKRACPPGWHLPTIEEWRAMALLYGGIEIDSDDHGHAAFQGLIAGGSSGFEAQLAGHREYDGTFKTLGEWGRYWSTTANTTVISSDSGVTGAFVRIIWFTPIWVGPGDGDVVTGVAEESFGANLSFPCRCVKDAAAP